MSCGGHFVYRFSASDGSLLYIGYSKDVLRRFEQHARQKDWWSKVAHIDLEHFGSREEALEAEKASIIDERPPFNANHNPTVSMRALKRIRLEEIKAARSLR